jgi:hypothetical protein
MGLLIEVMNVMMEKQLMVMDVAVRVRQKSVEMVSETIVQHMAMSSVMMEMISLTMNVRIHVHLPTAVILQKIEMKSVMPEMVMTYVTLHAISKQNAEMV